MERWRTEAIEARARALDQLRDGVQDVIAHLGTGFLRHPANTRLRDDLDAELDPTNVSRMARHANYRITLDMHVGTTAGLLDRARATTRAGRVGCDG
jgi:hypothetical protein